MTEGTSEHPDEPFDRFGLVGTELDGKHPVERLVAEGGFGVVYYGVQYMVNRPVAIKVLKTPAEFNDSARAAFIEKFVLEAQTIARISHPNIVQVLASGVSKMPSGEVAPWMMLEWLTGQTLEQQLMARRGHGGRGAAEALALLRPVFDALAYAHDEGIAHRDIKPANIMVVHGKRGATLKLMDFGIAKLMDSGEQAGTGGTRTRTSMNAFSPQYAAPEQISGTRTGPWTDVHALGLIASEVLSDAPPYRAEDITSLFGEVLSPVRPTPAQRGVAGSPWEAVLARALALRPDERYRNAGELLAALEAATPNYAPPAEVTGAIRVPGASTVVAAVAPVTTPAATAATMLAGDPPPAAPARVGLSTTTRASAVSLSTESHAPARRRTPLVLGASAALVALLGVGALTLRPARPDPGVAPREVPAVSSQSARPAVEPPAPAAVDATPRVAPPPSVPDPPPAPVAQAETHDAGATAASERATNPRGARGAHAANARGARDAGAAAQRPAAATSGSQPSAADLIE